MRNRKFDQHPKTHQFFRMWHNAMQRCYNPKNKNFKNYGGRGIKVHESWHKFENFMVDEWEPYDAHRQLVGSHRKDLSIDRINNNGDYEPGNIRYTSMKIQANNRRPSKGKSVTYNRKTQNITEWSKELNIKYGTLLSRLHASWPIEKAFFTPVSK